jgi:L-threonate 2-dehydrogenase
MAPTISIIAPGAMGAGLAARMTRAGARVLTLTSGRSAVTLGRARLAGMEAGGERDVCESEILLSIVPPGQAIALARQLAPFLRESASKPVFVDCNAVGPATVAEIAAVVEETGTPFVDGCIIGTPPGPDGPAPALFVSGERAAEVALLNDYGQDIRVMDAPVGAASTLKMSYAGITKGLTALASAMILAAERAGAAEALQEELSRSQKTLLDRFARTVPDMFPKAYRWVAEMEEIAAFLGEERPESQIYHGIAGLYRRLAEDHAGAGLETEALRAFVESGR